MNEKEILEIRRRFKGEKSGIGKIHGAYINESGEIVSDFTNELINMPSDEAEEILSIIKKSLSGTLGANLINIEFKTDVLNSEEHKLLMRLRDTKLNDQSATDELFNKIKNTIKLDTSYLILIAHDSYDVLKYTKDGVREEDSSEVFNYIICAVCPIKLTRPALSYRALENEFKNVGTNTVVAAPELGFMFPSFDDRSANIYSSLFYTKDMWGKNNEFIEGVFGTERPMPAKIQTETFQSVLKEAVGEDVGLEIVEAIQDKVVEVVLENKENKFEEPVGINKDTLKIVLSECGVEQEKIESFDKEYNQAFGENTELAPKNIMHPTHFEVETPDVQIKVNPERRDLITTRVINGRKYILISAEEGVTVNGVDINIEE